MSAIHNKSVRDGMLLGIAVYLIALAVAVLYDTLMRAITNPDVRFFVAAIHDAVRFLSLAGIFLFAALGGIIGAIPFRRIFRGNVPADSYWN